MRKATYMRIKFKLFNVLIYLYLDVVGSIWPDIPFRKFTTTILFWFPIQCGPFYEYGAKTVQGVFLLFFTFF